MHVYWLNTLLLVDNVLDFVKVSRCFCELLTLLTWSRKNQTILPSASCLAGQKGHKMWWIAMAVLYHETETLASSERSMDRKKIVTLLFFFFFNFSSQQNISKNKYCKSSKSLTLIDMWCSLIYVHHVFTLKKHRT